MFIGKVDHRLRAGDTVAPKPFMPATVGERWQAAVDAQVAADSLNSEWRVKEKAFDVSSDGLFALTGTRLPNPFRDRGLAENRSPEFIKFKTGRDLIAEYEAEVERLADVNPDKADAIRAHGKALEKAYARRNAAVGRRDDVLRRSPGAVALPWIGPVDPVMLVGSLAGMSGDPATLLVNAVGVAGKGASLLYHAARAALINGTAEIALQPFIKQWANEAGDPYTWSDAGRQVLASALLGGTLDAGVRGGFRATQRARGRQEVRGEDGRIIGWKTPEQVLDAAAKRLPADNPVRRAADGDAEAAAAVARAAGATDQPEVRGALDALELETATMTRVPGVDDGEGLVRLAEALRHADDPAAHPVPGRAEPVPEATTAKLADDGPLPARSFAIDGRPVTLADVDLKTTAVDPATFQFKGGADAAGATDRLQGVERWDPIAAGRAVVYERASGERVIADAHQRRALALRLKDQETVVPAFVFREADGWTPQDVRAQAAKKNLQEGSGSAMDAAQILRERPDILDSSVPLRSEAMRQARALARLSDEAFAAVKAGVVAPNVGALVGDLVPDPARHAGLLDEVAALDPANAREARLMVSELMQMPTHVHEQMTLLGVMRIERSLMKERVKVLDAALEALRRDARLFGLIDREAGRIEAAGNVLVDANAARAAEAARLAETIERLAGQTGPVSDWLNAAARAVAGGEKPKAVAEAFARRIADAIERDGLAGLVTDPTPLRAGGFDDPAGPDAQAQVARLERDLGDAIEAVEKPELAAERQAVLLSLGRQRDERWQTVNLPGYGTPEFQAARVFTFGGETVVGYDAAVARLAKQAAEAAGPDGVATARQAIVLIGPPGAGKSSIGARVAQHTRSAVITSDDPKFAIPEFDGGAGSSRVHEEASELADLVLQRFLADGGNVIVEKLGARAESIERLVADLSDKSYAVRVVVVTAPREVLLPRIAERAGRTGRTVPIEEVDTALSGLAGTVQRMRQNARVVGVIEVDNGGETPKLIRRHEGFDEEFERALQEPLRQPGLDGRGGRPGAAPQDRAGAGQDQGGPGDDRSGSRSGPEEDSLLRIDAPVRRTPRAQAEWTAITAALRDVRRMLPPDVRLRMEGRLYLDHLDADVYGYWDPSEKLIAVALGIGDPVRTARHETIHALRQTGLLSDQEFATLYRFAERSGLRAVYEIDALYAAPYKKAYGHHGDAHVEALLREETVATLFSDAAIHGRRFGGLADGGAVDTIIDMIREFLVKLRNALNGHGFRDVADVFEAIESGAVAARVNKASRTINFVVMDGRPLASIRADDLANALRALVSRSDASFVGLRVVDDPLEIGGQAPESRVWIDGSPTEEMLAGASAIDLRRADVADALHRAGVGSGFPREGYYYGRTIVVLEADAATRGIDADEIVMRQPTVVAIINKPTSGISPFADDLVVVDRMADIQTLVEVCKF